MASPRISLNKLGEYLTATPARRRRIVLDQQDPKAFIVSRYSDAREAIVNFMASGMHDYDNLRSEARRLRIDDSGTEFSRQDREASANAIEDFLHVVSQIDVSGLIVIKVPNSSSDSMDISGVAVSIRPDVYLKNFLTGDVVGAVKLHFPRTTPLSRESAEYVATALRVFLEKQSPSAAVDHRRCYVVDVSTRTAAQAPKAFAKKMSDIAAACEEIDARWNRGRVASS